MGTGSGLPLLRLLLAELGAPSPIAHATSRDPALSSIADLLPQEVTVQLPTTDVSLRLIDAYLEHCNFFSPIFYRADVLRMLDAVNDTCKFEEQYKIFMILAIAIQLLNRTDSSIPVTKADAFCSTASRILLAHSAALLSGDLNHLEILLLIIQYSSFSSGPAGTWHLIGQATRLAIDLGLHDEPSPSPSLNPLSLDRRRRLFWATYTFERNLCAVLGRPVSIPDEAIFVSLPASVDEDYITVDGILSQSSPSRTALAVHLIRFRQLESEVMQVLHQKPPLASKTFDHRSWRDDMRQRLYDWRSIVPLHPNPSQLAPMEIFDGCLYNSLLHLYSPSRHMPSVSSEDLGFLVGYAQESIEAYRSSFRDGKLRFYWRTVHNLFRSGVTLIYCLKNWPQGRNLDAGSVYASLNSCSSVLWGMVEHYPLGKPCRDTFETLYRSVQQSNTEQIPYLQTGNHSLDNPFSFTAAADDFPEHPFGLTLNDSIPQIPSLQGMFIWDT